MRIRNILFLGLLVSLIVLSGCSNNSERYYSLDVDPQARPIIEEEVLPKSTSSGMRTVAIPGWNSISIPAGYENVYVSFYNPDVNTDLYNLTFEWRLLNDSEVGYEVIYKSGVIGPGESTKEIVLSKSFEVGEYETTIFVQPYKISDNSPTNNANMNTKLIVK